MKTVFGQPDAIRLRSAYVETVKQFVSNGKMNYIMLSGGVDSLCVLYSVMEIGAPFKAVNFRFIGLESSDRESVKRLQEKAGFDVLYLDLPIDDIETLKEAVELCKTVYGKVRRVKVETIYAFLLVKKYIPADVNIISGISGDGSVCYHKKDAVLISKVGEQAEEVMKIRRGDKSKDEIRRVFQGYDYLTPCHEKTVTDVLTDYTTKACNAKFPKSCFIYAFSDYFRKYKNYRNPIGFHKASHEADGFERLARENGFDNALKWFNRIQ